MELMSFQSAGGTLASAIALDWTSGFLTIEDIQALSARERRRRDVASVDDSAEGGADACSLEAFDDFASSGIEVVRQAETETQPGAVSFAWSIDQAGGVAGKVAGEKSFTVADGDTTDLSVRIDVTGGATLIDGIVYHLVRFEGEVETPVLDQSSATVQRLVRVYDDNIQFTAWDLRPGTYRFGVSYESASDAAGAVDAELTFANTHHSAGATSKAVGNIIVDDRLCSESTVLSVGGNGQTDEVPGPGGVGVKGNHGVLTIQADGGYAYEPHQDLAGIGMTDTFTYQLQHPNGMIAEATLSIRIGEAPYHGGVAIDAVPIADQVPVSSLEDLLDGRKDEIRLSAADAEESSMEATRQGAIVIDPLAHLGSPVEDSLAPISSDV